MGKQPTERNIVNVSKSVMDSIIGLRERIITYGTKEIESLGVKAPRSIYNGKVTMSDIISLALTGYYGLLRQKRKDKEMILKFAEFIHSNKKISKETLDTIKNELKDYRIRS